MKFVSRTAFLLIASSAGAGNLDELFLDDQAALTGGAVVSAGSEPGMAWYNPAGLTGVDRASFNLGASAYAARFYYIPKYIQVDLPDGQGSLDLATRSFFSTPSSLVYASKLGENVTGALGIFTRNQLDVLVQNSQKFKGTYAGSPYTYEQGAEFDLRLKNYVAGPALGWKAAPWLSLGAGVFGAYDRMSRVTRFWGDFHLDDSLNAFGGYDHSLITRMDQGISVSSYSVHGNAGAQIKLPGNFQLGLAMHTPYFLAYTDIDYDVVLDGSGTTRVVGAAGIALQYHVHANLIEHPYRWNGPYRGLFGLSKLYDGGFVSLESDFSDLPAEHGKGMTWNYRLGWQQALARRWTMGAGAYTDLRPLDRRIREFGDTAIDNYGATFGFRYEKAYLARDEDSGPTAALAQMLMRTTLSFHYDHGSGDFGGVVSDPINIKFPMPVATVPFTSDELSVHLGGAFAF